MSYVLRMFLGLAALVCLIVMTPGSAHSYTGELRIPGEGITQVITLADGSSLVGKITEIRADQIKFQTDLGEIPIQLDKIVSIKEVLKPKETEPEKIKTEEIRTEEARTEEAKPEPPQAVKSSPSAGFGSAGPTRDWFPNPNTTRLLIGPTARTLNAGDGYLYDLWIFFPGAAYGITNNFMISAGASIIPDADDQMYYIMPKVGFPATENLDLAASLLVFRLWERTTYFGLGSMTYGTDDKSVTCALGIAFTNDEMVERPAAMFGGEYRLTRRASLVGEGWYIPGDEDDGVLGLGAVRLMGEKMTVDLGILLSYDDRSNEYDFYGNPEEAEVDWAPYFDFVWNF